MPADKISLHVKTQRKHFSWVHAVLDYASANGAGPAELVTAKALTKGRDSTPEHEKRVAWEVGELVQLLRAAILTGSLSLKKRVAGGSMIWHDGCYFIPLMLPLMGPRSAEAAGLSFAEVHEDAPIPYIHFQDTGFRVLKNGFSKRMVAIAPELIRLGFINYIKALRAEGEVLVFPDFTCQTIRAASIARSTRHWRAACFPEGTNWYKANGGKNIPFGEVSLHW